MVQAFPQHRELIETVGRASMVVRGGKNERIGWRLVLDYKTLGLMHAHIRLVSSIGITNVKRNPYRRTLVSSLELRVPVLKFSDGRAVEYDADNMVHDLAIYQGIARVEHANISKVRRSYWLGPHCLFDGLTNKNVLAFGRYSHVLRAIP